MVINVWSNAAHSISRRPFLTVTSTFVTTSVRPGFITRPRAINRSPFPGASRFILYSTVSTLESAGISVKAAYPPAESAMVPMIPP